MIYSCILLLTHLLGYHQLVWSLQNARIQLHFKGFFAWRDEILSVSRWCFVLALVLLDSNSLMQICCLYVFEWTECPLTLKRAFETWCSNINCLCTLFHLIVVENAMNLTWMEETVIKEFLVLLQHIGISSIFNLTFGDGLFILLYG